MWIAAILFFIILLILTYLDTKKPKNFPPGPKWWPIVGSALLVEKLRREKKSLIEATVCLSEKYGPVVGLKVGKDKTVVVHGYAAIKEFLSEDDLAGRPTGPFYEIRTWGKRLGILLTDEDFWQEQRRFVLRQLREFGFGRRNMSHLIEEEIGFMIDRIGHNIEVNKGHFLLPSHNFFSIHILNTLWTMMAGTRYSPQDKKLQFLQKSLNELLSNIDMVGTIFSHFPILRHIAPEFSGYNLYVNKHKPIWTFIEEELQRHKESFNQNELRDLMDVYLLMLQSPKRKTSFSETQLLAICLDLFMAGMETTNNTTAFTITNLVMYPEVQKKAQEEIDRVIGRDRRITLLDRPKLQYMECVTLEAFRVFSSRVFTVPHRALRDTYLQGYFIPKDTMVVANLEGVLKGKECGWTDGDVFRPERFLKDGKVSIPEHYLPFGFGKHRCMGETLAKANIFLMVSSLLQHFNFSVPPGAAPPTGEYICGVTPSPLPYNIRVTLR